MDCPLPSSYWGTPIYGNLHIIPYLRYMQFFFPASLGDFGVHRSSRSASSNAGYGGSSAGGTADGRPAFGFLREKRQLCAAMRRPPQPITAAPCPFGRDRMVQLLAQDYVSGWHWNSMTELWCVSFISMVWFVILWGHIFCGSYFQKDIVLQISREIPTACLSSHFMIVYYDHLWRSCFGGSVKSLGLSRVLLYEHIIQSEDETHPRGAKVHWSSGMMWDVNPSAGEFIVCHPVTGTKKIS